MVKNYQKHDVKEEDKRDQSQLKLELESRQRVWQNLEKLLDQFEQDLIKNNEEIKMIEHYGHPKNYFNWDFK